VLESTQGGRRYFGQHGKQRDQRVALASGAARAKVTSNHISKTSTDGIDVETGARRSRTTSSPGRLRWESNSTAMEA
jgi:hypothetical protein